MEPYNQQQYWDANVRPPAQQQQQSAHHPSPSHQPLAQHPTSPLPPYYYGGDQQQHWNANMWPPSQQQQQLTHHPPPSHQQLAQYPPPPRPPYYYGGDQQQYWNANMWPPAQQQQPLGHYPPPSHQQSAQYPPPPRQPYYDSDGAAGNVDGVDEVRTLYIGRLQDWMDEDYLNSCFGTAEQFVSAKIIRRKRTGQSEGYGFLEFGSRTAAENVLQSFNGEQMPNSDQSFDLNWASCRAEIFEIYVGNLDVNVTDSVLQETFKSRYASVKSAKVIRDRVTGHSNGFGFVRFGDETEKDRSLVQMRGYHMSNRPIRVSPASAQPQSASQQNPQGESYRNNTKIYVEGLPFDATSEDLTQVFSHFGAVVNAIVIPGTCCGLVHFYDRSAAETATSNEFRYSMEVRGKPVKVSWGRNATNRRNQPGASQSGSSQGYQRHHRQ